MLTQEEIVEIAKKYVQYNENESGIELIISHEYTIEKPYGNVFLYTSKLYKETGDFQYAIAGNAPFLVEKETGRVVIFGTAYNKEYYIDAYEKGALKPSQNRYWYPSEERYSDE